MTGFYMIVSIAGILAMLATFFLGRQFKDKPLVRYIPSLLAVLAGIASYIKARFFATGFEDIGFVILALIACIVFFLSFLTAFIMGILQRNRDNAGK
ncbi:hypothetical protein [Ruminiclostridium hungatei]|nr:hypothetical protein [Ruminiclostridium hungatei]